MHRERVSPGGQARGKLGVNLLRGNEVQRQNAAGHKHRDSRQRLGQRAGRPHGRGRSQAAPVDRDDGAWRHTRRGGRGRGVLYPGRSDVGNLIEHRAHRVRLVHGQGPREQPSGEVAFPVMKPETRARLGRHRDRGSAGVEAVVRSGMEDEVRAVGRVRASRQQVGIRVAGPQRLPVAHHLDAAAQRRYAVGPARELHTGSRSQRQGSRGDDRDLVARGVVYRAGSRTGGPVDRQGDAGWIGADRQAVERLVVGHPAVALRRHRDHLSGRAAPRPGEEHIVASGGVNLRHRRRDGVLRAHAPGESRLRRGASVHGQFQPLWIGDHLHRQTGDKCRRQREGPPPRRNRVGVVLGASVAPGTEGPEAPDLIALGPRRTDRVLGTLRPIVGDGREERQAIRSHLQIGGRGVQRDGIGNGEHRLQDLGSIQRELECGSGGTAEGAQPLQEGQPWRHIEFYYHRRVHLAPDGLSGSVAGAVCRQIHVDFAPLRPRGAAPGRGSWVQHQRDGVVDLPDGRVGGDVGRGRDRDGGPIQQLLAQGILPILEIVLRARIGRRWIRKAQHVGAVGGPKEGGRAGIGLAVHGELPAGRSA